MNKDLTTGNPEKVLWQFCIPLFASVIFQQIYNIADSLIAGKFIGEDALAAVGNSYEITLVFIAFAFGCNIGCSVIVSQFFGAKQYDNMKTAISTSLIGSGILCLLLMIAGIIGSNSLLEVINTPNNIFADSKLYLNIYIWGLPFVFFYNISTGIFSALGDSKTPFCFLAASSTANIFMDILFVQKFNMGIAGVAWATFICQGISCILSLLFVFIRLQKIKTSRTVAFFSFPILKKIASIAIPSIMQQSFISVGNVVIQGIINDFGSNVIAGYSAAIKLNNLVITSFTTLGNGISNFTAQNIGANRPERIRQGFVAGRKIVWMLCIPMFLLYFFGGGLLISFFMNEPSQSTFETGILILRIISPFYFIISLKLVADGILRGLGMMKYFMFSTFTDLLIRVSLAFVLSRTSLGSTGIWCAWPVGWTTACICSVMFYQRKNK